MKSASVLGCMFISLCLMRSVESNFGDFLSGLPRDIGDAFSSAWNTLVDAIKNPVRIKRLGHGGKRKTIRPTTTTTVATTEPLETVKSVSSYSSGDGLRVPVLPTPMWRTIDEWKNLQVPRFVKIVRNGKGSSKNLENEILDDIDIAPTVTGPASLDDEDNFGVLFFV